MCATFLHFLRRSSVLQVSFTIIVGLWEDGEVSSLSLTASLGLNERLK
jgi:hypothetical protein